MNPLTRDQEQIWNKSMFQISLPVSVVEVRILGPWIKYYKDDHTFCSLSLQKALTVHCVPLLYLFFQLNTEYLESVCFYLHSHFLSYYMKVVNEWDLICLLCYYLIHQRKARGKKNLTLRTLLRLKSI